MADIDYFTPPLIKEMLEQQRMILEIQKELLKAMVPPITISKEKKDG